MYLLWINLRCGHGHTEHPHDGAGGAVAEKSIKNHK